MKSDRKSRPCTQGRVEKRVRLRLTIVGIAGTRCDDEVGPSTGILLLEKTKSY